MISASKFNDLSNMMQVFRYNSPTLSVIILFPNIMKNKNNNGQPRRRLREVVDGPVIRRLYATMPTAELAGMLGLTVKQIENYAYRHNTAPWAHKSAMVRSAENSQKGKKGGRPPKIKN